MYVYMYVGMYVHMYHLNWEFILLILIFLVYILSYGNTVVKWKTVLNIGWTDFEIHLSAIKQWVR